MNIEIRINNIPIRLKEYEKTHNHIDRIYYNLPIEEQHKDLKKYIISESDCYSISKKRGDIFKLLNHIIVNSNSDVIKYGTFNEVRTNRFGDEILCSLEKIEEIINLLKKLKFSFNILFCNIRNYNSHYAYNVIIYNKRIEEHSLQFIDYHLRNRFLEGTFKEYTYFSSFKNYCYLLLNKGIYC